MLILAGLVLTLALGYYVFQGAPRKGRRMQAAVWRAIAENRHGALVKTPHFHALAVPVNGLRVTAMVADRALLDGAIAALVRTVDLGGWRTFVQAAVPGGAGLSFAVYEGRGTVGEALFREAFEVQPLSGVSVANLFTPEICRRLSSLRGAFKYIAAGPTFITMELPGLCDNGAQLEAALMVIGALATGSGALTAVEDLSAHAEEVVEGRHLSLA